MTPFTLHYNPREHTVLDILRDISLQAGDAEFLATSHTTSLTYAECRTLSETVVAEALSFQIQKSDTRCVTSVQDNADGHQQRVVVLSPNGPLVPLVFWASWHLGVVVCPLSASAEPHLWASMVRKLDPSFVLVATPLADKLASALSVERVDVPLIALESLIPGLSPSASMSDVIITCSRLLHMHSGHSSTAVKFGISPDDTSLIMFTSSPVDEGSIKAVSMNHGTLLQGGQRIVQMFGPEYGKTPKRHLGWLPLSHVFELYCGLFGHVLHTGGSFIFFDPAVSSPDAPADLPLPELILRALEYHRPIQSLCAVPILMEHAYAKPSEEHITQLRQLQAISAGGAPTSDKIWRWAKALNIPLYNLYGITEAAGGVAGRGLSPNDAFELMGGLMGVIEKEDTEDDYGELIIVSEYIPNAYIIGHRDTFRSDHQDQQVSIYCTGDRWRIGPDCRGHVIMRGEPMPAFDASKTMAGIYYMSRVDDTVVLASGIKVDALAMEHLLDSEDEITRSAILPSKSKESLLALIQPSPTHGSNLDAVVASVLRINLDLPYEKRIQRENIILVDHLPVTTKATLHRKAVNKIIFNSGGEWPLNRTIILYGRPVIHAASSLGSDTSPPARGIHDDTRKRVQEILANVFCTPLDAVQGRDKKLSDLPMNSLAIVRLARELNKVFGCNIKHADIYESQTVDALCSRIVSNSSRPPQPKVDISSYHDARQSPIHLDEDEDAIVITGASCRFPGDIRSLDDLWQVLAAPTSFVQSLSRPAPPSRWKIEEPGSELPMAWLSDDDFDNKESFGLFFALPPSEVDSMPPNSRLVLQMAYSALEDAGIAPKSLSGRPWGVYTCMNDSGWKEQQVMQRDSKGQARLWYGAAEASAGARLSYFLNLTGPAMEIKTACSSSAVAIHQACLAIQNGDCEGAIIVASTTFFAAPTAIFRMQAGIGSPSGRCATFSDTADGFLPSEGAAAIVIQKAVDVSGSSYGRIRGTAIVQDGRSLGFAAPNPEAQTRLLEAGLRNAKCDPNEVLYIEAHGTGTPVGDVIEFNSINEVYGQSRTQPLVVGSVKAVLGHTEECAGLAGVLKSLLCFQHGIIPPQPHIRAINPELDLFKSKAIIPRSVLAFPENSRKRVIAVSSFGLSGTLANIILEESHETIFPKMEDRSLLFLISARTEDDFRSLMEKYVAYAQSYHVMETALGDACRTTQIGRDHLLYRRAWSMSDWKQLANALQDSSASRPTRAFNNPAVSVWFTLPHSHQRLPAISHPLFDRHNQACRSNGCPPELQPFADQLSLARMLEDLGCRIVAVGGEGVAEYCAAAFAGIIPDRVLFALLTSLKPEDGRSWLVEMNREDLEDSLLDYRSDQVRIVGKLGDASYLHTATDWDIIQGKIGSSLFKEAHPLTCATHPRDMFSHVTTAASRMDIVSAHLGEMLDYKIYRSSSYWTGLPQRSFDTTKAQQCLSASADMMLKMSGGPQQPASYLHPDRLTAVGTSLESVIGRLYELGCPIRWDSYTTSRPTCHLPTYVWAPTRDAR